MQTVYSLFFHSLFSKIREKRVKQFLSFKKWGREPPSGIMPEIHKDIIYLVIIKSENGQLNLIASIDAST